MSKYNHSFSDWDSHPGIKRVLVEVGAVASMNQPDSVFDSAMNKFLAERDELEDMKGRAALAKAGLPAPPAEIDDAAIAPSAEALVSGAIKAGIIPVHAKRAWLGIASKNLDLAANCFHKLNSHNA